MTMGLRHMLTLLLVLFVLMGGTALFCCWLLSYCIAGKWLQRLRLLVVIADGASFLGILLSRSLLADFPLAGAALQIMAIFFMMQLILGALTAAALLVRRLYRQMMAVPLDRSRRHLLRGAAAIPAVAGTAGMYGGLYERCHTVENRYDIFVPNLPEALEGYTVAQLSDIHLGLFFSMERLRQLLQQAADGQPDVLVITGDLFDDEQQNAAAARLVDSFCEKFPQGIYFCRGNHEYLRGIRSIEQALQQTGIHELVNRAEQVLPGAPLYFVGVDYPMERSRFLELQQEFTTRAFADVPAEAVTVLLAHHPDFIDNGRSQGAALTLTGHTHGGQLGFLGVPLVPPVFHYMRGMYRQAGSYGYVHSGNSSWFPYRFGCPPEVAYFRLCRAAEV